MSRLSVNVNKLATLRNARGKNTPDVTACSRRILEYGAHGITVHPRPDGRHIRAEDVWEIGDLVAEWNRGGRAAEFNVEGYPSPEFLQMIERAKPDQATLVPDPPEALTSNAGWDLVAREAELREVLTHLRGLTRVSLFVDPAVFDGAQVEALARLRPDRVELYTEAYADAFGGVEREKVTGIYRRVGARAAELGLGVNAGHDLNQANLGYLLRHVPQIEEVSIGHALICEALCDGLETTVRRYLAIVESS